MGWSIGYDSNWARHVGYGVPCVCDHPDCDEEIHRGLSYVCGNAPFGGEHGCGLFFCSKHRSLAFGDNDEPTAEVCERCEQGQDPFDPKPDTQEWIDWKLTDESWAEWRAENPEWVAQHSKGAARAAQEVGDA